MNYKDQSKEVKEIIINLATEQGYGHPKYTNLDEIDYKFWKDTNFEDILIIVAKRIVELMKDKLLLDKLQMTTQNYGNGWKLRRSTIGRGMRLHETSGDETHRNVRDAIEKYNLKLKK